MTKAESLRRPPGSGVAVARALEVLRAVEASPNGIGVAGIQKATGASASAVRRVLLELERTGRVERIDDPEHAQRHLYRLLGKREPVKAPEILQALCAALAFKSSSHVWGDLIEEQARSMIRSFTGSYSAKHASLLETAVAHVEVSKVGRVRYRPEHLDVLLTFLDGATYGQAVKATYRALGRKRGQTKLYSLVRIFPQDGALYLLLRDLSSTEARSAVHALHRFLDAERERTHPVSAQRSEDELKLDAWIGGTPVEATLRVASAWVPYFEERDWFEPVREWKEDGNVFVTAKFSDRMELFRFVLSHVPYVRIVAPEGLDEELREWVDRM